MTGLAITDPVPDSEDLRASLTAALAAELPAAIEFRHELHRQPELSGAETGTSAAVAAALGAPDAPDVAGTGRLIRIGPPAGPSIAIRAELDALPLTEQTGAAWSSRNGAMHACGHDVHLAALTALGRAARRADLPVALLAVLQPREETIPSGARDICGAAAFAAEQPRAVIGVHLQHQLDRGTVAAGAGIINAASDEFEIEVVGIGGHAGYPQLSADPVPALCQAVLALQQLVSRRTDPTHAVVVSVGTLEAGQAANIIPGAATARGTLRTLDERDREFLHGALRDTVSHVCQALGCEGRVRIAPGEPALVNDEQLATASQPLLREAGFAVDTGFRSCGSDDFSYYATIAPTLMLFAGSGTDVTLHHPGFLPADTAVGQIAAAMLAGYLAALR